MDYQKRMSTIREYMKCKNISFCVVLNPDSLFYLSGFKAITYSRPIGLIINQDSTLLIVPALEEEHAKQDANVDNLYVYYEHPEKADGGISFFEHFDSILSENCATGKIGIEFDNISLSFQRHLSEKGFTCEDIGQQIKQMRFLKDEDELELIREAGQLVDLAVAESLANAAAGVTEMDLDQFGNHGLFNKVSAEFPDANLDFFVMSPSGIERSIMPHVFSNTRKLQSGDVCIHSRQVGFNGYRAECERTIFIGQPRAEQVEAFDVAVKAQKAGIDIIKAGITAKEVDLAARKVIQDSGFGEYAIHRVGHAIGISSHEQPYLRFDSDMVLEAGMVFSIEPGIYIPEIGGFRHSDTVIVKEDGCELVTHYPRDLDSLIFG
ncbi:MAG: Xaa-Pro peptidase family protein [Clostridia bacterium]|nr:Xaa-Pro peptidase family protein [Clostridia bacterium]